VLVSVQNPMVDPKDVSVQNPMVDPEDESQSGAWSAEERRL